MAKGIQMKYTKVTLLVGHPEEEIFDCGCDQTFALSHLHNPEIGQYVIAHDRGFISEEGISSFKHAIFTEEGGI